MKGIITDNYQVKTLLVKGNILEKLKKRHLDMRGRLRRPGKPQRTIELRGSVDSVDIGGLLNREFLFRMNNRSALGIEHEQPPMKSSLECYIELYRKGNQDSRLVIC